MSDVISNGGLTASESPQQPINPIPADPGNVGVGGGRVETPQADVSADAKAGDDKAKPDAPKEPQKRKPESVRESLQAAKKLVDEAGDDEGFDPTDPNPKPKEKAKDGDGKKADDVDARKGDEVANKPAADDEGDEGHKEHSAEQPDGEGAKGQQEGRGPETRQIIEAPSRLLPRSKELWKHVPHEVRADLMRIEQERNEEIEAAREARTFAEELREYKDLAAQHNVSIKQALDNYVGIERKFAQNPPDGFRELLNNLGMHPTQAMGAIMQAFGVTPQVLADHLLKEPHMYTQLARRPAQPGPGPAGNAAPDPAVNELRQEVAGLREAENKRQMETITETVIVPFANEHPEYYQHQAQIAQILKSGIIEQLHGKGLSLRDRLEVALSMVAPGAISKAKAAEPIREEPSPDQTPVGDLRGGKSIKSSIGGVTNIQEPRKKMSLREVLEDEARKTGIRR